MLAIELSSVSKGFRNTSALQQISLQVCQGERLVVLGCSGAGKTTLLRIIAGLETLDSGSLQIEGADMSRTPPAARSISMVSQDFAIYPHLTVRKNLEVSLDRSGWNKTDQRQRVAETLHWFELQKQEMQLPCHLSGGEAQRAAFAKALVSRPRILLLDEPLSQIDTVLRESLLELIVRVSREFGLTIVMVTHSPMDAMRLADRIAILDAGRLIDIGVPQELYGGPKAKIAANLLSPLGVNWFDTQLLSSEMLEGSGPRIFPAKRFFGFRPESAAIELSDTPCGEGLHFVAETLGLQELGFAKLLSAIWQGHTIRVLAPRNYQSSARVRICVRHDDLLWVDQ